MENTINNRIRYIYRSMGLTIKSFCEQADISEGSLKNMFSRGTMPSFDVLNKISTTFPNINAKWLLSGDGEMYIDTTPILLEEKIKGAIPYYADIPVSAGQAGLSQITNEEKPTGYMLIPNISAEKIFPVIGCSMLPQIKAGDVIGVNRVNRWDRVEPDKIYMIITNEERMIKRLRIDNEDNSILWCVSENYHDFRIYKSEIVKIFHVVYHGELL